MKIVRIKKELDGMTDEEFVKRQKKNRKQMERRVRKEAKGK